MVRHIETPGQPDSARDIRNCIVATSFRGASQCNHLCATSKPILWLLSLLLVTTAPAASLAVRRAALPEGAQASGVGFGGKVTDNTEREVMMMMRRRMVMMMVMMMR